MIARPHEMLPSLSNKIRGFTSAQSHERSVIFTRKQASKGTIVLRSGMIRSSLHPGHPSPVFGCKMEV